MDIEIINKVNDKIKDISTDLENITYLMNTLLFTPSALTMKGIDLINKGIKIIHLWIDSVYPNVNTDLSLKMQIQNIGSELQYIGNHLQNYDFITNFGNQNLNFENNQIFNKEINMNDYIPEIKPLIFYKDKKQQGINISLNSTVEELIKKYFELNPDLQFYKRVYFMINGVEINKNDKSKIGDIFKSIKTPNIYVYCDKF